MQSRHASLWLRVPRFALPRPHRRAPSREFSRLRLPARLPIRPAFPWPPDPLPASGGIYLPRSRLGPSLRACIVKSIETPSEHTPSESGAVNQEELAGESPLLMIPEFPFERRRLHRVRKNNSFCHSERSEESLFGLNAGKERFLGALRAPE